MAFWFVLFLYAFVTIIRAVLGPRTRPGAPQPSGIGDFQLPTAEEGRAIPVAFGTCKLGGPNVVWYGDFLVANIHRSGTVVAYKYYLGIQYALCHGPVDDVIDVLWDGKSPGFTVVDLGTFKRLSFNATQLFGGEEREGGVVGDIEFYLGGLAQVGDPYLQAATGATLPGYRGICYAVLKRFYLGTSSYLKPIAFVVKRLPNQLGLTAGAHDIAGDANPAAMLYEILTDARWGLGISSGLVDDASFAAAGVTLKAEALGLSMVFDTASPALDFLQEVLRHIDGLLYTDPQSGRMKLKLIRADYSVPALPLFDPSNVRQVTLTRPSWDQTRNHVRVRYIDRTAGFVERVAQAQDRANIEVRNGEVVAEDFDFRGLSNKTIAQRVAARTLKTEAYPLAALELVSDRSAWALRPGDVFRLTWPKLALVDMVCRVVRPQGGELADGKIRFEAAEDIFPVAWTGYEDPPPDAWVPPITSPTPLGAQRLLEAPFELQIDAAFNAWQPSVMTLGATGASHADGYQVFSDPLGGTAYLYSATANQLTPTGRLLVGIDAKATSLTVQDPVDVVTLASITAAELAAGKNQLLVDDELVAWQTVTNNGDGTFTISGLVRGIHDTTPKTHATLARVWFVSGAFGYTTVRRYPADLTVSAKLTPFNAQGMVLITAVTAMSLTTTSRAKRPYVAGAIQENGVSYPVNIADDLVVTWKHRDRDQAWSYANAGETPTIAPLAHYRIKVYGEAATLIHTEDNLTGLTWTYVLATEISESGALGRPNERLRVVVEAITTEFGGQVSYQAYDHMFDAAGWGMLYGDYYGGQAG